MTCIIFKWKKKIEEEAQQLFKEGDKFGEKNIQMEKE